MACRTATASPGQPTSPCLLPPYPVKLIGSDCLLHGLRGCSLHRQGCKIGKAGAAWRVMFSPPCRINVVTKEDALEFIQTAEQRQHDEEQQQQHV